MATKKAVARAVTEIPKLPTDFKDDILDPSMEGKRRYLMTENPDGTISLEDVSIYTQVGNEYGDNQINTANSTVNALIDKTSELDSVFVLVNKGILTFTNKICTISDARITADSLADVYFTSESANIAESAVITVETYNGEVELTAGRQPEGTIRATIIIRMVQ